MIEIVKQTLRYYINNKKAPALDSLEIEDKMLLEKRGSVFVTLYMGGEVHGSAGNIDPIEDNMVGELVESAISALANDDRFEMLTLEDLEKVKIRIDVIATRVKLVNAKELENLEPKKLGVAVIKKSYDRLAVILPNISSTLHFWKDFAPYLTSKLWENFVFSDFIVFKLETTQTSDF